MPSTANLTPASTLLGTERLVATKADGSTVGVLASGLPVSTAQAAADAAAVSTHNADTAAHGQTATGRALVTAASVSAARTTLGLGTSDQVTFDGVTATDMEATNSVTIAGREVTATGTGNIALPATSGTLALNTLSNVDPAIGRAALGAANSDLSNTGKRLFATGQRFIFAGTSITLGTSPGVTVPYPAAFASSPAASGLGTVTNAGRAGHTLAQLATAYTTDVKPVLQAAGSGGIVTLVLEAGANDYTSAPDAATFLASLQGYIATARADADAAGVSLRAGVCTIMRRADTGVSSAAEINRERINRLIRAATSWDFLIDLDRLFPNPYDATFFVSGGVHPNDTANRLIAAEISQALVKQSQVSPVGAPPVRQGNSAWLYNSGAGAASFSNPGTDFTIGTGDFSVGFWCLLPVYQTGSNSNGGNVIGGATNSMSLSFDSLGRLVVLRTNAATIATSTYAARLNEWTHFAVVRSSGTLSFYVNGVLDSSVADATDYSVSSSEFLGRAGGQQRYQGYIADLAFAKRALAASEIRELMGTGSLSSLTNVSALLLSSMRPAAGVIQDTSGLGHHVTLPTGCTSSLGDATVISATVNSGSAVSISNAVAANGVTLTLTPGTWEVDATADFFLTGATTSFLNAGISTSSAAFGAYGTYTGMPLVVSGITNDHFQQVPRQIITVTANTTIYLVGRMSFSAGTVKLGGFMTAKRL